MQYGQLISRSLSIVWRRRYLWLLAILGGADVGGGFSTSFPNPSTFRSATPGATTGGGGVPAPAGQFLADNAGLIVAIVAIALVVALGWFLLSCVTTGALIRASAEHDAERPFGLGPAWRAGVGTFWHILGLRLLALAVGLAAAILIGLLVLFGFLAYAGSQSGLLAAIVVVGVLVVLALIPAAIVIGIAFTLATRSLVLEQRGPIAALGRGLNLMGARLGRALLVWLIQVGLSIGVGIALVIVLVLVFVSVGALLVAVGFAAGQTAAIIVGIPVGLVLFAALIVVSGMINSYFSTYWTLAFRRMELDAPAAAPWPPPGYQPPPPGYPPQPTG